MKNYKLLLNVKKEKMQLTCQTKEFIDYVLHRSDKFIGKK